MTPTNPLVFDTVRIDGGENYNPGTGIYTVPVNGFYEFYVHIYVDDDASFNWAFYIQVDGTFITDSAHDVNDGPTDNISSTATVILNLLQGQQVSVAPPLNVALYGAHVDIDDRMNSYFSGRLIMAT